MICRCIKRRGKIGWIPIIIVLIILLLIGGALIYYFQEDKKIATKAVKVGNPSLQQFPNSSSRDYYARSVWDMHYYKGRIYIGSGDMIRNRGPIDVWSFEDNGKEMIFKKEITVDEEQVHLFREYGNKLFIPGMDAKESWDFGNIYIKEADVWKKLRTIPRGLHVIDIALFNDNLYVYITSDDNVAVLESKDMGQTWEALRREYVENKRVRIWFGPMVALKDCLLVTGREEGTSFVLKYADGQMETQRMPLFPGSEDGNKAVRRLTPYKNGVLYSPVYLGVVDRPSPLFFLEQHEKGAVLVDHFRETHVQDIVVRSKSCYILTVSTQKNDFKGCILSSTDLKKWTKKAEFIVPALPFSFEIMGRTFFVGLGHTLIKGKPQDREDEWAAGDESGSIWRIDK